MRDTIQLMADESTERGRTVRVHGWWPTAARARMDELKTQGIDQKDIAEEVGISGSSMTRILRGNVNVEDVQLVARRLDLPPPVIVPVSEAEARAIDHLLIQHRDVEQRRLRALDAAAAAIAVPAGNEAGERGHGSVRGAVPPTRKSRNKARHRSIKEG